MTQFHESAEEHLVVSAALEALFESCAAQGVPREKADRYLGLRFGTDRMLDGLMDYLNPPVKNPNLIKAAYEAPDAATSRKYALQWLKETHGVALGDDIEVYGWVKPREIVLTDFTFFFSKDPERPSLVFSGMTATPQKVEERDNLVPYDTRLTKHSSPSNRMRRYL